MAAVKHAKASGANLYPHKFNVSISLPDFVAKYKDIPDGSHDEDTVVTIAGRVYNKRASGAKLVFYDVQSDGVRIQVMADARCGTASHVMKPVPVMLLHSRPPSRPQMRSLGDFASCSCTTLLVHCSCQALSCIGVQLLCACHPHAIGRVHHKGFWTCFAMPTWPLQSVRVAMCSICILYARPCRPAVMATLTQEHMSC